LAAGSKTVIDAARAGTIALAVTRISAAAFTGLRAALGAAASPAAPALQMKDCHEPDDH